MESLLTSLTLDVPIQGCLAALTFFVGAYDAYVLSALFVATISISLILDTGVDEVGITFMGSKLVCQHHTHDGHRYSCHDSQQSPFA